MKSTMQPRPMNLIIHHVVFLFVLILNCILHDAVCCVCTYYPVFVNCYSTFSTEDRPFLRIPTPS